VYTNHIHADDLAMLTCAAVRYGRSNRTYNATDDSQIRMGDYFDLVADRFGLPRVPRLSRREAEEQLSPLQLSFMSESRRLLNQRIKKELRVRLRYARSRMASQRPGSKGKTGAHSQGAASVDGGQLVCRPVLPAADFRQSGDGCTGQRRRT
jgi:hypothetical protein